MKNEHIKIKKSNIIDLFNKNEKFIIPLFQREFTWNKNEIIPFLESIIEPFRNKINGKNNQVFEDFFGNFLLQIEGDEVNVIDGQQRLTVLFLFFLNLYDKYKEVIELNKNNFNKRDERIVEKLLKKMENITYYWKEDEDGKPFKTLKIEFKNDIFQERFNSRKKTKNLLYYKANKLINDMVEDLIIQFNEKFEEIEILEELIHFLTNEYIEYFSIGLIEIDNIDFAIDTFEKMNTNKVDLSEWDLLRSLYMKFLKENNQKKEQQDLINLDDFYFNKLKKKNKDDKNIGIVGDAKNNKDFFEIIEIFIKGRVDQKKEKYINVKKIYENKPERNVCSDLENFKYNLLLFLGEINNNNDSKFLILLLSSFNLKTIKKYLIGLMIKFINDEKKVIYIENVSKKIFIQILLIVVISNKRSNKYENIIKEIYSDIFISFEKGDFDQDEVDKKINFKLKQIKRDFDENIEILLSEDYFYLKNLLNLSESSSILRFNFILNVFYSFDKDVLSTITLLNSKKFNIYPFENENSINGEENEAKHIFFTIGKKEKNFNNFEKEKKIVSLNRNIKEISEYKKFQFWVDDLKMIKNFYETNDIKILNERNKKITNDTVGNLTKLKEMLFEIG